MSFNDLPTEILFSIADALSPSPSPSLSSPPPAPSYSYNATLHACAATCRILRAVVRPLLWARVELSDDTALCASAATPLPAQTEYGCSSEEDDLPSSRTLFLHALSAFHTLLEHNPEIAGYVKDLCIVLPEDGLQPPDPDSSTTISQASLELEQISTLILSLSSQLSSLRNLSLVSYNCNPSLLSSTSRSKPRPRSGTGASGSGAPRRVSMSQGPFRVDFDTLPRRFREGVRRMLMHTGMLRGVELRGVVLPPGMVLRLGGLEDLTLVAQCPMDEGRLREMDSSEGVDLSLESSLVAAMPALTTLRLGFCDATFLRYITSVYGAAFAGLREISLNVIERDLEVCQWFLDVASSSSPSSASSSTSHPTDQLQLGVTNGRSGRSRRKSTLESFSCTIRCNTALSSYHGPFALHALDFSACSGLKTVSLRYLLLSRVTESVRRAIGWNVRSALEARRAGARSGEDGGEWQEWEDGKEDEDWEGEGGRGVEELNIVVDWAGDGDEVLVETFREVDGIVKTSFITQPSSSSPSSPSSLPSAHLNPPVNLKKFTLEATHWPCPDARNCAFRRAVSPPLSTHSTTLNIPSSSTSRLSPTPVSMQCRRPTPLRTSSSPAASFQRSSGAGVSLEGSLDRFFPFLCSMRGEGGMSFESRYVLEHRREGGLGCV